MKDVIDQQEYSAKYSAHNRAEYELWHNAGPECWLYIRQYCLIADQGYAADVAAKARAAYEMLQLR